MNDRYLLPYDRSSFCSGGHCVEVAWLPDGNIAVRDSKDQRNAALHFSAAEWIAFVKGVKAGEFDFDLTTSDKVPTEL